ncbi:MAG TPA: zinc transporter ZupT [Spirochaetota bacterium]|nr:zinc transporter ZupT [Spirochaetota bacterium]HPC39589.1 zinc transporter ZupT [Spirochaetota bacterium]HPL17745.1 zinc transporter ZupT [Spirochaetota bacterium]HQF09484.1 zinc transporter ZupT [Spirochaetota bacterium]HQH98167.1 zinc transporter ZupT [Spirochaetota bacterium]
MDKSVIFAFALTIIAGLSTGIGSIFAFFTRRTNTKFLAVALGFSAGVMIYVSFVDIFMEAKDLLVIELGKQGGMWATVGAFFGGIFIIALIDYLVPSYENPHESHMVEEIGACETIPVNGKLFRSGLLVAAAITIHNFPEGIATFTMALKNPSVGIAIAFAIAVHNIPEGIAVSIPVFCATGKRKKAFFLSLLSGFAEPLGALLAYIILLPFLNNFILGIVFASVAGIMIYISFDELLPASREYGEHHLSMYGLIAGMIIMSVSLVLLG